MKFNTNRYAVKLLGLSALLAVVLLIGITSSAFAIKKRVIRSGDTFPEIALPSPEAMSDSTYLGVASGQPFIPSQIKAEVVLIEFLNVHCPHCAEQAPSYNKLYNYIQKQHQYRDKIKMFSIAVGNTAREVETFKAAHNIPFPVLTDTNFVVWRAIGAKASPFSLLVRQRYSPRTGHSAGLVCDTHTGTNHNYRKIYSQIIALMEMSETELAEYIENEIDRQPPEAILDSDEYFYDQTYHAFRQLGRVAGFKELKLDSFDHVYRARIFKDKRSTVLYAKVVNRFPVCDVCHKVKLIYIFNSMGEIIAIEPLDITKKNNVAWDAEDMKKLKQQLVGRNLRQPQPFDPSIDAITSATMSTAIIYDSIGLGEKLMEVLKLNKQLK